MKYYTPIKQPDGSTELKEHTVHFWQREWWRQMREALTPNNTVCNYADVKRDYDARKRGEGAK